MAPETTDLRPSDRAPELIKNARTQYQFLKTQQKPDQLVEVICAVHNESLKPNHVSSLSGNLIRIQCLDGGSQKVVFAAVEQVAISMRIVPMPAYAKSQDVTFQVSPLEPPPIPNHAI